MTAHDLVALVHLAGFLTGIVLYAMLAVMTLRERVEPSTADGRSVSDTIPLATAGLGLLWNSGALVIYALRDFGIGRPSAALVAIAFMALGFLPAVVVHSAVRPRLMGATGRALVVLAYALSAVAGLLQAVGAAEDSIPSRPALLTLTVGYAVILVVLTAHAARDHQGWRRSLFIVALAAFAVSALHLSHHTERSDAWFSELIGHHASLPLILVILYQDYRFAFADLFLRRALALVALVALAVVVHVLLAAPLAPHFGSADRAQLLASGVDIALAVLTALAYPLLRRATGRFVDRIVLQRADFHALRAQSAQAIMGALSPEEVLQRACDALAPALSARRVAWRVDDGCVTPAHHASVTQIRDAREMALVHIPTADLPCFVIEVGELAGGRRLLSDDIALLEWIATLVARRIDLLRVTQERFARDLREREIVRLATEAELRALRAQLNPHFLFNALTTVGYLLRAAPDRALATLYRLTDLLRAVLRRTGGEFVTLGEELEIIEAYLDIERERFEERLAVAIDVPTELRRVRVPPLLLQPLVENAIKHGITPLKRGGQVTIEARVARAAAGAPADGAAQLLLAVADTGVGMEAASGAWRRAGGLGLVSVEQRLAHTYGASAALRIEAAPGRGTRIEVSLPLAEVWPGPVGEAAPNDGAVLAGAAPA